MKARERIEAALNHKQPDKVAVDFGGTPVTGIAAGFLYKLRKALGLKDEPIKISDPYQMLGYIDDELMEYLESDVVGIMPDYNAFGIRNDNWKKWNMPDGTPVLVPGEFNTKPEADGRLYMYPKGDLSAKPSAVMPRDGYYFDAVVRQHDIDDDKLNVFDNLEEFTILGDDTLRYLGENVDNTYKNSDRAILINPGTSALGDIALVPGLSLKDPKGIRDIEEWYVSMIIRQGYLKELFSLQTDIAIKNFKLLKEAVGDKVTAIYLCGTDFGTQNAPFCSTELFDDVYLKYYKKMTDWIHENTSWKVFKHSCGAVFPLIESFIKAGIDILNPVQCSAEGMDPVQLKEKFGDRITFWGGGIDTQKVLPFGTIEEVKEQVNSRIDIFSKGGGFVFNSIHNIQSNVPVDNFLAMMDVIKNKKKGGKDHE